jgi:hypothetical protein
MLWQMFLIAFSAVMTVAVGARQALVDPAATLVSRIEASRASLNDAIKAATLDAGITKEDGEPEELYKKVLGKILVDRRVIVGIQGMMDTLGYDPGPSSGEVSPKMSAAITEFQIWYRMPPTGQLSDQLVNQLLSKCQIGVRGGGLAGITMSLGGACPKPEEIQGMGAYKVLIPGGGPNEGTIMQRPAPVR